MPASIVEVDHLTARAHFLRGSSYFRDDLPSYLSVEPLLAEVDSALDGKPFSGFQRSNPGDLLGVNYEFMTNKDGRFAWRPYEMIHPAIYVSLVNLLCEVDNWATIRARFSAFSSNAVECCSIPLAADPSLSQNATQVRSWWQLNEQRSLIHSLEYSHLLHTDVANCYGSLYTHSIVWAIHGKEVGKEKRQQSDLLGNQIDKYIQSGRYGQTNGISQGSLLMDLLAELVLGFVDEQVSELLPAHGAFRILRYRDDYRIFANSDDTCESIVKALSTALLSVGMRLGVSKTVLHQNVVEGSIKADKLAGIALQGLDLRNAKTMQKELLRLHSFGLEYPNSGALRRLVSEFHRDVADNRLVPDNLEVCTAIATDIGYVSPTTFPAVAGIISYFMASAEPETRQDLWTRVCTKMRRVPHNGYLEIWLQRATQPSTLGLSFASTEPICQLVGGFRTDLWENGWISSKYLLAAMDTSRILVGDPADLSELIEPIEVALFNQNAFAY